MISCGDLHLRLDIPIGRIDNYLEAQESKFRFILRAAKKSPPLLVPGDFLDKARPPIELLYWIMSILEEEDMVGKVLLVPGQHDLLWHSLKNLQRSAISLLDKAGYIKLLTDQTKPLIVNNGEYVIWPCPYGMKPVEPTTTIEGTQVLVWHNMVINKGEELWPGQNTLISGKILRKYKKYSIICTGDNHNYFLEKNGQRILLNSGSMMRMKTDQQKHKPAIFKIEGPIVETIPIPIQENVLSDDHITEQKECNERIKLFLSKLKEVRGYDLISFKSNLKEFFNGNVIEQGVEQKVWEFYPTEE
jgi:hypothetical protein